MILATGLALMSGDGTLTLSSRGIRGEAVLCLQNRPCDLLVWSEVRVAGAYWILHSLEDRQPQLILQWLDSVTARVYVSGPDRFEPMPRAMVLTGRDDLLKPSAPVYDLFTGVGCVVAEENGRRLRACPSARGSILVELNGVPTPGEWIDVSATCSSYDGSVFLPFRLPDYFRKPDAYLWVWKGDGNRPMPHRTHPIAPCLPEELQRNPDGYSVWAPWTD